MSTSKKLADWRRKRGLTYPQAAEITGISQAVLQKIETGKLRVTEKSARKLAKTWGLKRWDLLVTEASK